MPKKGKQCPRCNKFSEEFVETLWRGPNGMRRYLLCPKCSASVSSPSKSDSQTEKKVLPGE